MTPAPVVLSAQIAHETNTFSVLPTGLADFRTRQLYEGDDIARVMSGTRTEMAAHIEAASRYGWQLVQPLAASATPSGRTTAEAWAWLEGRVLDAARASAPAGVLLALHGAMVVDGEDDAEGRLLAELRALLGPDVPIAVTLDLHANVSDAMAANADFMLAYRTYPHVDQYEVATEAAAWLDAILRGGARSRVVVDRPASLLGCNHGRTAAGPMLALRELALAFERNAASRGAQLVVSCCAGFPWADVADSGPSAIVCGTLPEAELRGIARFMSDQITCSRSEDTVPPVTIGAALEGLRAHRPGGRPLVLADFTDNPGHGGYGDHVGLLRALLDAGLADGPGAIAIGSIHDPAAVVRARAAGVGAELALDLGSRVDPVLYGPPLALCATVESLSDGRFVCAGPMMRGLPLSLGDTAVLRVGAVRIIVSSFNVQTFDLGVFRSQGIEPEACSALVVKSAHHFRGAFEPIAAAVMLVDAGGLASHDLSRFHYTRVRRPVWPLDPRPA